MERFADRRVLITGAGSGIGQATVRRILAEGGRVVALDRNGEGLAATRAEAAENAERLTTMTVDIADEAAVRAGVASAVAELGGLDVLVNAAGVLRSAHTHETTLEFWNSILRINLTGTFLVTREALPALLASGRGVVINFSSTSAGFAHPYMAAYAASKGGIQSFTHVLASEYASQGLRAVALAPGSISSDMTTGRGPDLPEDADMSLFTKLHPAIMKGMAPPETVAGLVAALASDDGAFVTGTELRIDGGTHM